LENDNAFWDGPFSGAMFVFGKIFIQLFSEDEKNQSNALQNGKTLERLLQDLP